MKNYFQKLRQGYGNLKLQSKFALALMLAVTLPMLLSGSFFFGRLYDMIVSYTVSQEQNAALKTSPLIEKNMEQVTDAYSRLTRLPFYSTVFHAPISQPFSEVTATEEAANFKGQVERLLADTPITGLQIYVDFPSEEASLFTAPATKDYFSPISRATGTYWYGIFSGSHAQELFCPSFYLGPREKSIYGDMAYIRPTTLYYMGKPYLCYIALYHSSDTLKEILSGNLTLEGSVSYIVNERDSLVASSDQRLSGLYWLNYESIEESFLSTNNFIRRTILENEVYAGIYSINRTDWYMVTILPSQPMVRQGHLLLLRYGCFYIVFLLFALVLANSLAHSVTNRISSVAAQMRKVRFGPPVPMESPKAHDEIGDLVDTYNYMTRKMQQLIQNQGKAAEDLRIAEFNSLQAQINPHFLYNTMDMINWLAQQGRTEDVCSAVQNLSRFYKLTLSQKKSLSTIAQETEHVSIYIRLQNMRFHNNISFVCDIPDELMEYQIPKLTLQPVIENAILHGILEKASKSGTIVLTGWMEDSDIVLLISDDGVGIPPEKLSEILSGSGMGSSGGTNIAIYNTHRRIQILYGKEYGLSYSSECGSGTEVQIRIPAQKEYQSPYVQPSGEARSRIALPLVTVANPEAMTMNAVSPETLLQYSQKLTRNLYTLKNLHQISEKLSPAQDIYVLAHEVTGDFPSHNHDYFELNYLCRGSIVNIIDGNEIYMTSGDFVFLNRRAVHSLRYIQPDALFINFCLKPEAFTHTLREFYEDDNLISRLLHDEENQEPNYLFFSLAHSLRAQAAITSIIQRYAEDGFRKTFALEGYFLLLFDYLATSDEFSYSGIDSRTHKMVQYLQKNCLSRSPEEIARHFQYSVSQFDSHLKRRTGRSLESFIREARLAKALELLDNPKLNIYEIAESCGYAAAEDFFREFNSKFHISPTEYRNQFL